METKVIAQEVTDAFAAYHGDNIEVIDGMPDNSVGLTVSSVPFPGMYVYHPSPRDVGNSKDRFELVEHFRHLVSKDKLMRVTMPGRHCVIHLTQQVAFKTMDGFIGLFDFRGDVIRMFQEEGWIWHGECAIVKNPQAKAVQTKDAGLQFKSLKTDAARLHPCLNDYLLWFRKPGDNPDPIPAGEWFSNDEWISAARGAWEDIRETFTLNYREARSPEDEKHLCPLQRDTINRCIRIWSNPWDVILDPFMGIGSTPYEAVMLKRKGVGIELKDSYYATAVKNLREAEHASTTGSLLSLLEDTHEIEHPEVAEAVA